MSVDFASLVRSFNAHLTVRGFSARTRHTYRRELVNFWIDWCALREVEVVGATAAEVEAYVASLPARGSKRGEAIRALKAFYSWLVLEHRLDNPSEHLVIPRSKVAPAPSLAGDDEHRLLRAAFRQERRRGWALMLTLHTGARVSSIVNVRPKDVDLRARTIWFHIAKGDRPYGIPLDDAAMIACRHLLRETQAVNRDTLLGVGAARFRQWVHLAEGAAGLERVWPHLLRHEFSNRVARSGDPEAWRRLMNHVDLSQWSRYVHADEERLKEALKGV